MLRLSYLLILTFAVSPAFSQKMTIAEMKSELEKSPNPPLYVKDVLKKKFRLDTVVITRTSRFISLADSLAYKGKIKQVFGPYSGSPGGRFLVQVLAKVPNTFYRISQIYIDTSVFRYRVADSLGKAIIARINNKSDSFEHLAQTYSMGGEATTLGDLGWVARGSFLPEIENELRKRKKNEVFSIWTRNGLHIIKMTQDPKQDDGAALMMRVFL
ncbi:MAG TPA: peptidylprolyl isomerase [Puia sp.]|nr:peptidylprolyl isomerase [Puia sp.]